jgi:hypothetical protein
VLQWLHDDVQRNAEFYTSPSTSRCLFRFSGSRFLLVCGLSSFASEGERPLFNRLDFFETMMFQTPFRLGRNGKFWTFKSINPAGEYVLQVPFFSKHWFGVLRTYDNSARAFAEAHNEFFNADFFGYNP